MARKMDDIRSFFSKGNSKTKTTKQKSKQAPRKPSVIYINDDDDDDVTIKTTRKGAKRKRLVISDSESEDEIFENAQKKPTESVAVVVSDKSSSKRQEISSAAEYFKNFPTKRPTQEQDDKKIIPETPPTNSPQEKTPPTKKQKPSELMEMIKQKSPTPPLMVTPPKPKEVSTHSTKNHTPSTTPNTSTQPKPPSRSASYMAYLNRGGPSAPGSKPIPQGAENCLSGLTFVFTGVGESLDRDECSELAEKYGGRVTKSISRKTTYVVVGTGAGEKKIAEAQKLNINQIDEDGFLELIRTRDPPKYPPGKSVTPSGKKRKTSTGSKGTDVTTPTRKPIPPNPIRGDEPIALLESGTPSDQLVMDISGTSNTLATTSTDIVQSSKSLGVVTPPISTPTRIKTNIVDLWVEKYKPATTKQIIGQQTNNSCMKRLTKWLMEWHVNNKPGQSTNGTTYKAALLSGPPGIGKTTTAVLVCQETGFSFTELNASASRSRKTLQETVASSLKSSTVDAYFTGGDAKDSKKHVLIMDEVDGIAGNEDRGGIQELIYLIQATKIPIICICNDRQHTKIRSLANHCLDLRFHQPKVGQIKGPMMSIAFKEGIKIDPTILQNIITSCSCDIRQVLNNLSVWAGDKALCDNRFKDPTVKRPILMTPFDVVKKVFNPVENGTELTLREKSDLFFQDYSIGPLFVQENYLNIKPLNKPNTLELLKLMSDTADAICQGDLISKVIRTDNSWELLPCQAIFSSVLPGELMRGYLGKPPEFPRWLGNFSKTKKYDRILQELQQHTRLSCLCNKHEFGMDYAQILRFKITEPLIKKGDEKSNIAEVCDILNHYDLTRTDWENLVDVTQFTSRPQLLSLIDTKVKTAFTRYFNKNSAQLPYNTLISAVRKKRRPSNDDDDEEDDEQEDEEELIKIIKKNGKKDETSSKNKRRKITP